jgi:tripartite-type tricarboxylate transporter receptor subunit TctC
MKQPMVVSLKGGASGGEALMYMKSSDGDPHKVLIAYSLIYMLPLSAKLPFNWRDLTPVSVDRDGSVHPVGQHDLPYKNVKEFIAAAKAANPPFKMGGTGSKREDQVITAFIEKKTGAKFAYLPYKSVARRPRSSSATTRRRTSTTRPRTSRSGARAGARALRLRQGAHFVQDQSHRHDVLERHPTCKEEGLDVEYLMLRAMFLPGKVSPDVTAFYVDLFKKVAQTPEYKDYMEKQALKPVFLSGKEMVSFLEEDDKLNYEPDDRSRLRRQVAGTAPSSSPPGFGRIRFRNRRRRSGCAGRFVAGGDVDAHRRARRLRRAARRCAAARLRQLEERRRMGEGRAAERIPPVLPVRHPRRRFARRTRLLAAISERVRPDVRHARPAAACAAGVRADVRVRGSDAVARPLRRELPADRGLHAGGRQIALWKSLLTAFLFVLVMFATFDLAFDVIMPKGPIEALFGR